MALIALKRFLGGLGVDQFCVVTLRIIENTVRRRRRTRRRRTRTRKYHHKKRKMRIKGKNK
jgi:hypothetical protein